MGLAQKSTLRLIAISVALWGCLSVRAVSGGPIKIMPLGDSITFGIGSTNNDNGYRKPLYQALTAADCNFDFVGNQTNGDFPDPNHEGHPGWQADAVGTDSDILGQVYNWLTANPADIVLLHIGTNDITVGGQDANEISAILDEIDRFSTNTKVILALIIDRQPHSPATTQFNIDVNNMAQNRIAAGDDIIIVDMEHALDYNDANDMADSLHPNDGGYAKMADVWYDVLYNCLTVQRTLTSSSTTGGSVIYPGEGAFQYDQGVDANLVATADPNYHFVNWTGTAVTAGKVADPNSATTTVTMDANYTVVANFAIDRRTLTSSSTAGGSVTIPGEGAFQYDHGTDANLAAAADPCYYFANWTGTGVDAGKVANPDSATTTITMDADYTVVANFAAHHTWDGGGGADKLWGTATNWSPDGVPSANDVGGTAINIADANCLIDSNVAAACNSLNIAYDTGPCYLRMTGGTLTTTDMIYIGDEPGANGYFIVSGGSVNTGAARMRIAEGKNLPETGDVSGTLIIAGGDVNVGGKLELAKNQSGTGQIYMYGGTLRVGFGAVNEDFELATYGTGTFYMYGGEVNCDDRLRLGQSGGTGRINLYGGTIYCSHFDLLNSDKTTMDVTEGRMRVETDADLATIQGYVNNGMITGYGGEGVVSVDLQGGGVWVTASQGDPNLASSPNPSNYATVEWTPAGPTLSWKPGQYAASHDVYFGTVFADVNDANNASPEFKGNQDPNNYAFPLPPPTLAQTYYWRIDEVNDANVWKGRVWQFKIADFIKVEDFESYADDTALQAVWTLTGSEIALEKTAIHSDKASMKYHYDNSGSAKYTEASAKTTGASGLQVVTKDWTADGIKALTLYFYGEGGNSAEKMFVALRSGDNNLADVYYSNPNDLKVPAWHEWNIKLSDFNNPNNVNLSDVNKVYIGFGNRENPAVGGSGNVYFDDIRLYPRRCAVALAGDMDGDCDVDFMDVNTMAGDWLNTDYNGVGRDGVLMGGASWVNDATRGRCVQLDGVNGWVNLDDDDFSNFHNKTIAFWVKIRNFPPTSDNRYLFFFKNADATVAYRIYFMTHGPYYMRLRFIDPYTADSVAGLDTWRHLVFVLRDTDDGKCTGEFYVNGLVVDDTTMIGRPRHSGGALGVNIGSDDDGAGSDVNAVYDDFRVYDYALSATEVLALYNATRPGGSGTPPEANMLLHYDFNEVSGTTAHNSSTYVYYHPLLSRAELYTGEAQGSRIVNFRDFAILANNWLKQQLWP